MNITDEMIEAASEAYAQHRNPPAHTVEAGAKKQGHPLPSALLRSSQAQG